jgi:tRNA U34 2-thiouridine synthase MnmA/TrmU
MISLKELALTLDELPEGNVKETAKKALLSIAATKAQKDIDDFIAKEHHKKFKVNLYNNLI